MDKKATSFDVNALRNMYQREEFNWVFKVKVSIWYRGITKYSPIGLEPVLPHIL
jgi:hypothetical protein